MNMAVCLGLLLLKIYITWMLIINGSYADDSNHDGSTDCTHLTATSKREFFQSPGNFPKYYDNHADECWIIESKEDKHVRLDVWSSKIETLFVLSCRWADFIEVLDGNDLEKSHMMLRWCGWGVPPHSPFISSESGLTVIFQSDYNVNTGGFNMSYQAISEQDANSLRKDEYPEDGKDEIEHEEDDNDIDTNDPEKDWRLKKDDEEWKGDGSRMHKGVVTAVVLGALIVLLLLAIGLCIIAKSCKKERRPERLDQHNNAMMVNSHNRGYIRTSGIAGGPLVITANGAIGYTNAGLLPDSPSQKRKLPSELTNAGTNPQVQNLQNNNRTRSNQRSSMMNTLITESPTVDQAAPPVAFARSTLPPIGMDPPGQNTTQIAAGQIAPPQYEQRASVLPPIGQHVEAPPQYSEPTEYTNPVSPPPPYSQ